MSKAQITIWFVNTISTSHNWDDITQISTQGCYAHTFIIYCWTVYFNIYYFQKNLKINKNYLSTSL